MVPKKFPLVGFAPVFPLTFQNVAFNTLTLRSLVVIVPSVISEDSMLEPSRLTIRAQLRVGQDAGQLSRWQGSGEIARGDGIRRGRHGLGAAAQGIAMAHKASRHRLHRSPLSVGLKTQSWNQVPSHVSHAQNAILIRAVSH